MDNVQIVQNSVSLVPMILLQNKLSVINASQIYKILIIIVAL